MRIIAGKYKSRQIRTPTHIKDETKKGNIRPTSDRARETIFDILTNLADFDSMNCLDLFAGTGSFGFECISRGAGEVTFVDISSKSIDLIKRTAEDLKIDEKVNVFKGDAIHFLKEDKNFYDIIFADPPYKYEKYIDLLFIIYQRAFSFFVLETGDDMHFDYDLNRLDLIERNIGAAYFKFFISKQ